MFALNYTPIRDVKECIHIEYDRFLTIYSSSVLLRREVHVRRALKVRTKVTITMMAPMPMATQAQRGVAGGASGAGEAVAAGGLSLWKPKIGLQSLGVGSRAITLQK